MPGFYKIISELLDMVRKRDDDIRLLLGKWFSALEDEGINPWIDEDCMKIAKKYWYTEDDYKKYLSTIA